MPESYTIFFFLIKPVKLYVFITFVAALCFLKKKTPNNKVVVLILAVSLLVEIINSLLLYYKMPIRLTSTISVVIVHSCWLWLLLQYMGRKAAGPIIAAFLLFCVVNLLLVEGCDKFNFNAFILGSLMYISIFVYKSFYWLRDEDLSHFTTNNYLLLCAPLLYFFGLSFLFGFKTKALGDTIILGWLNLYDFVIYFVNIVYYSLINIYIYQEKKLHNAR